MHSIHRCLSFAAIVAVAGACSDPVSGPVRRPRQDVVSSAPVAGRVVFLPPLGVGIMPTGASDVSRPVAVEICVRADTVCVGDPIARIDTGGTGDSRLRVIGAAGVADAGRAFYEAVWRVPRAPGDTAVRVRASVLVDGAIGGQVDVRVIPSGEASQPASPNGEVVIAGDELVIRFWIEKPPRRFTVLVGPGVRGMPGAGDSLWSYGARVPYAFAPAPGYENVMVRVDGMPAPPAGLVITDTEHVLTVTADRRVVLNKGALPLYQQARAVLSAADPVAAYQAYLDVASAYVASSARGVDSAMQDVRDVEFVAFDPIRDSAALRKLDGALAGHVLTVDSVGGAKIGAARQGRTRTVLRGLDVASNADSTERTVFLYVNGIATPQFGPQGAVATQLELRAIASEIPLFQDRQRFQVRLFYNRTYSEQRPTPEEQRAHCVSLFASRLAFGYLGANGFGAFMAACTSDSSYRRFSDHDLLECVRQMWAIIANSDAAEVDATVLASRIQEMRSGGLHVILVPHSQGNLMANQAIHRLHSVTAEFDAARDSTCIGLVSLASPTSRRWELDEHYIAPIVVRGDVVPMIDNEWPPIDTDLSHQLLDNPSLETVFRPTGIILHEVIESYFLQPQSRAAIRSGLEDVYRACAVSSLAMRPSSLTLQVGASGNLSAIALNAFGDTLGGRSVTWTTSTPSVVSVNGTGPMGARAVGVRSGGASIVATRMQRHAEAAVVVVNPAPTEDPFSFTYVASYAEGFFGDDQHLSGTVAHPGAVPLPAGTLRLSFSREFGRLSAAVNTSLYTVSTFGLDSLRLGGNPGTSYRLVWNGDHTTLTGTLDALTWIFHVGFVPAILPVLFERQ